MKNSYLVTTIDTTKDEWELRRYRMVPCLMTSSDL